MPYLGSILASRYRFALLQTTRPGSEFRPEEMTLSVFAVRS